MNAALRHLYKADGVTPVGGGVVVDAGLTKIVTSAELGDFAANQYLNCTNNEPAKVSLKSSYHNNQ